MVGKNWDQVSLARLPIDGAWNQVRLGKIAKQHDIDYARAKNLQEKWQADTQMIAVINKLPGKKTLTERIVRKIMQAKKRMKL